MNDMQLQVWLDPGAPTVRWGIYRQISRLSFVLVSVSGSLSPGVDKEDPSSVRMASYQLGRSNWKRNFLHYFQLMSWNWFLLARYRAHTDLWTNYLDSDGSGLSPTPTPGLERGFSLPKLWGLGVWERGRSCTKETGEGRRIQEQQNPQMTLQGHQLMGYPSPLLLIYHSVIPFSLPQRPHHSASLNTPLPSLPHLPSCLSALFSHLTPPTLTFIPVLTQVVEDLSFCLLCDLKAFSCPLCASLTISRFLLPAGAPRSLDGVPGWQRTGRSTEHGTGGSSSALCQWPPPQPQGCAGAL